MKKILTMMVVVALLIGIVKLPSRAANNTLTTVCATPSTPNSCTSSSFLSVAVTSPQTSFQIGPTYGGTVEFLGSNDNVNFYPVAFSNVSSLSPGISGPALVSITSTPGQYSANNLSAAYVAVVEISASSQGIVVTSNTISVGGGGGAVTITSGTVTANAGTGYPTPIPNSSASPYFVQCITNGCPTPPSSQTVNGTVTANAGTGFPTPIPTPAGGIYSIQCISNGCPTPPATQTVSGTVTANAGTGYPTPIPNSSASPYFVQCITNGCPTPPATQTVTGTVTANAGTGYPSPIPNSSTLPYYSYVVNTVAPVTASYSTTGVQSPLSLQGIQYCVLGLSGTWNGVFSATATDGTGNSYAAQIHQFSPSSGPPVTSVSNNASYYWIDTAGMTSITPTISGYVAGTASLRCDSSPGNFVQSYMASLQAGTTLGKIGYTTGTFTGTAVGATSTGAASVLQVSSTVNMQPGESLTITSATASYATYNTPVIAASGGYLTAIFSGGVPAANDTFATNSTQLIKVPLTGAQSACLIQTQDSYVGTAIPELTANGINYQTTNAISELQSNYGSSLTSLTASNQLAGVRVGSHTGFALSVTGFTAGSFSINCDVSESIVPAPVVVSTLPAVGLFTSTPCTTGTTNGAVFPLTAPYFGVHVTWLNGTTNGTITYYISPTQITSTATPTPNTSIVTTRTYTTDPGGFVEPISSPEQFYITNEVSAVCRGI